MPMFLLLVHLYQFFLDETFGFFVTAIFQDIQMLRIWNEWAMSNSAFVKLNAVLLLSDGFESCRWIWSTSATADAESPRGICWKLKKASPMKSLAPIISQSITVKWTRLSDVCNSLGTALWGQQNPTSQSIRHRELWNAVLPGERFIEQREKCFTLRLSFLAPVGKLDGRLQAHVDVRIGQSVVIQW